MSHVLSDRLWSEMLSFLTDAKDRHEDTAPRLILADWLEEHGDASLAARGELIRLQCWAPFTEASRQRQRELLERYADEWLVTLRPAITGWDCRRGFFHVGINGDALVAPDQPLDADDFAWIDGLSIGRLLPPQVVPLLTAPWISWLTVLDLAGQRIGDEGAIALAENPGVMRLRELYLRNTNIGDAGARALAQSPHLKKLKILSLSNNRIGLGGTAALADSPLLAQLSQLTLRGNSRAGETTLRRAAGAHSGLWLDF